MVKDFHLKKWIWPFGWVKWRPAKGGKGEGEVSEELDRSSAMLATAELWRPD